MGGGGPLASAERRNLAVDFTQSGARNPSPETQKAKVLPLVEASLLWFVTSSGLDLPLCCPLFHSLHYTLFLQG